MTDAGDLTMDVPETADEPALRRVRAVARLMDEAVRVPGTDLTVGLDPVLGALPGAGDLVSAGVSLYIVAEAAYLGVPLTTVVRMLANVAVDATVGSVPVLGTVFDVFWKANKRNVAHIESFLADAREEVDGEAAADATGEGGEEGDAPVTIDITDA